LEYLAKSGTVTNKAELAPMTELNWATMPQANTVLEDLVDVLTSASEDTPLFAVVAQRTIPRPARGTMTDLILKRSWILEV